MAKSPKTSSLLSLIILNFNSGPYLAACLNSIAHSQLKKNQSLEIIIVDNASTDTSITLAKKVKIQNTKFLILNSNLGFSGGNNYGVKKISPHSQYVLFLNPDTIIKKRTLAKTINFLDTHSQASAATCKIILAKTGRLQPECHRGFPSPWRSFCYFSGLYKIFPHSALFNGYFLGNLDLAKTHVIEAGVGAFLCVRREIGDQLGWWNEKYFMYGEDLDFCYQLFKNNYRLYFYPHTSITHFQGISSGIKAHTQNLSSASVTTKIRSAKASVQAMRTFYQQNYFDHYNSLTRTLVSAGINLLESLRVFKAKYL